MQRRSVHWTELKRYPCVGPCGCCYNATRPQKAPAASRSPAERPADHRKGRPLQDTILRADNPEAEFDTADGVVRAVSHVIGDQVEEILRAKRTAQVAPCYKPMCVADEGRAARRSA